MARSAVVSHNLTCLRVSSSSLRWSRLLISASTRLLPPPTTTSVSALAERMLWASIVSRLISAGRLIAAKCMAPYRRSLSVASAFQFMGYLLMDLLPFQQSSTGLVAKLPGELADITGVSVQVFCDLMGRCIALSAQRYTTFDACGIHTLAIEFSRLFPLREEPLSPGFAVFVFTVLRLFDSGAILTGADRIGHSLSPF